MSGKQTTTQNTSSEPWGPAQPALQSSLTGAQNLYNSGVGGQTYTGSTTIPYAQQSTQALQGMQNLATANTGGAGTSGQYQSAINNGGFNAPQMSAVQGMQGFASGGGDTPHWWTDQLGMQAMYNPAQSGYSSAAQGGFSVDPSVQRQMSQTGQGPSYSEQNMMGIARGDMLNRPDPNFERALAAASESAANQINLGASAAGRYGGAIHQGNVAREIGNYEAGQRVGQYNTERGAQAAANAQLDAQRMAGLNFGLNAANSASQIDQANRAMQMQGLSGLSNTYLSGINTALGAAGQSAGIQQQNAAQRMAANQNLFGYGQQGFNNLGSAYAGMTAPYQDLRNVGSAYEDLAGRLKNDELRIWNGTQNDPWNRLALLSGIASGAGRLGSTSTATAQVPGQSPLATGLGYGAGLLSLFGGQ